MFFVCLNLWCVICSLLYFHLRFVMLFVHGDYCCKIQIEHCVYLLCVFAIAFFYPSCKGRCTFVTSVPITKVLSSSSWMVMIVFVSFAFLYCILFVVAFRSWCSISRNLCCVNLCCVFKVHLAIFFIWLRCLSTFSSVSTICYFVCKLRCCCFCVCLCAYLFPP